VTKRYDEVIVVTSDPLEVAAPVAFTWRDRRYDIDQCLMSWREAGEWWNRTRGRLGRTAEEKNGMREREYWRVLARPAGMLATGDLDSDGCMRSCGAVYDLYRDRTTGGWRLARLWD